MANTILLKKSGVANSIPLVGDLAFGELAINYIDGNLFYKTSAGAVTVIASNKFLTVTGNVTGGNILTGGLISATSTITSAANITGGNILFGSGIVSGTGNITGGNILTGGLISATSTITSAANITGGNILTGGLISSTGTITGSSYLGAVVSVTANITGGNLVTGGLSTVTGNITGGNLLTGGLISATGNVTGNYFFGNGSQLTGIDATSIQNGTSNVRVLSSGGNVAIGIGGTSNVAVFATTGEYVTGLLSVTGNAIASNVTTAGLVTATGNVTGGNLVTAGKVVTASLTGTSAVTVTTGSNGNINLQPNGTGNIVLANTFINSVAYPAQDQDAASKIYVDNMVSTALTYHTGVLVATIDTLANTTGGTITYTQPNGVSNGVGALLTTTGSFNLIDTGNVQTINTRILVKNEANAVLNGVYTWANATNIVRSTDTDTYGPDSTTDLSINDYFFVSAGNVNAGSAYVVDAPSGTITFGTSSITFAQFSSSQVYTANTSAGLLLSNQTFNAKVDNTTTAFDGGGNIIVKTSANLTTPNIGAATGSSVSVTGNVTAGNINTGGVVSATGNVSGGNVSGASLTGSVVSASGNITGGNLLTGGLISATANITGGNLTTGGTANIATIIITTLANVTSATTSTSTSTGALKVAGGVGVVGNIYGGALYSGGVSVLTINDTVDGGTY